MAGLTHGLKDFTSRGNSFTSGFISNFLALGEALGFQETRDSWSEVFPQNAACHKTMLLLWMNVYTSGNVFKVKTCQKEGAHSEWELQKHGLCSSYCAKGMGHSQSRLNFSLSYCKLSQKLLIGQPCQLVGLCPGVAACYCSSVGHALTALLTPLKVLPQNQQAEIGTQFVCQ